MALNKNYGSWGFKPTYNGALHIVGIKYQTAGTLSTMLPCFIIFPHNHQGQNFVRQSQTPKTETPRSAGGKILIQIKTGQIMILEMYIDFLYIYIYVYIYICIYVYMYICIYVYIYIYMYTDIHYRTHSI